jgi:predicted metal-dependent peptidase
LLAGLWIKKSEEIPTAATDGINLFVNEEYFSKLNDKEALGLLLHECYHVIYEHMDRRKSADLDPQIYNYAGDYYINNDLDRMGYQLPQGGLIDHKYNGWSTRKIYDDLWEEQPEIDQNLLDVIMTAPEGMTETEHKEAVTTNIVKAVTQAKLSNDYDSVPGAIARRVEQLLNPKLPWYEILMNYMTEYAKDEYTWTRPNRRFWPDVYLPSMCSENLGQISVGIDVSGSINQEDMDAFMTEIRFIYDFMKPNKLRLMAFDTEVKFDQTFTEGDTLDDISIPGGGGTNIMPLMETLIDDEPEMCIVFSDMEFSNPYLENVITDLFWIRKGEKGVTPSKGVIIDYDN